MSRQDEESPVYYREIQKHAYLKRIPEETSGSKLRPLGHKKPPLKPMWTLFCVHNGRVPYLEQYPSIDAPCTASHRPLWRACLRTARHVTASVTPRGNEHDFLIHTDSGPLRLLAPDWESMQDWVTTLRNKLHELKILPKGENVYCAAPAPPPPRAGTRDPTSPLPPTPPVPLDRVPGIELVTPVPRPLPTPPTHSPPPAPMDPNPQPSTTHSETTTLQSAPTEDSDTNIDISDWDSTLNLASMPSTSNASQSKDNTRKKLKICGQNICLDDSIFSRTNNSSDDEEFFSELDRINSEKEDGAGCAKNYKLEDEGLKGTAEENGHSGLRRLTVDAEESGRSGGAFENSVTLKEAGEGSGFMQRLVVGRQSAAGTLASQEEETGEYQSTNITVIQVSNKPPHTAIPVMGPETDVFNFDFAHNLSVKPSDTAEVSAFKQNFNVKTAENGEKTTFKQNFTVRPTDSSETSTYKQKVTVKPTNDSENVGEKYVNVVKTDGTADSKYGTVFSDETKESDYGHISLTTTVSLSGVTTESSRTEGIYERLCQASTSTTIPSPSPLRKLKSHEKSRKSSLPNLDVHLPSSSDTNVGQNQTYEYLYPGSSPNKPPTVPKTSANSTLATPSSVTSNPSVATQKTMATQDAERSRRNHRENSEVSTEMNVPSPSNARLRPQNARGTYISSVPVIGANVEANVDVIRSNIERSHSQNAYDSPRLRDRFIRKESGKCDVKIESKPTQAKPIWRRGLTELSLLSRLRGIGQGRRAESPTRHENNDRNPTSPAKVQPRSRRDNGGDSTRRRSSSLSNGQPLLSLRAREAAALQAAQARGAVPARLPRSPPPLLTEHDGAVWVAFWGAGGAWHGGRAGDRLAALRGRALCTLQQAHALLAHPPTHKIDILFHRVPLAKIYILNKEREDESLGIKLDNDCAISSVEANSPAARAGLPPPGAWALTECNNRALNLLKGGQEDLNRLSSCGKEVSVLIQPVALVRKLRATLKSNKSLLGLR